MRHIRGTVAVWRVFMPALVLLWLVMFWLTAVAGSGHAATKMRVWVDTDAACGAPGRVDPDDCFALYALAQNPAIEIVGVSTVFGNAGLETTDAVTRALAYELAQETGRMIDVHRGAATPFDPEIPRHTDASRALAAALEVAPLTLIALGPLTNLADVFSHTPHLAARVEQSIAVMGKREGHAFHPAEGASGGVLFGHGPIFSDFNLCQDIEAARLMSQLELEVTLLPYELARQVEVTSRDLEALQTRGGALGWIALRTDEWLAFWQEDVGRDGFYPFDLLAADYLANPHNYECAMEPARIAQDHKAFGALMPETGLLVGTANAEATHMVTYCTRYLGSGVLSPEGSQPVL